MAHFVRGEFYASEIGANLRSLFLRSAFRQKFDGVFRKVETFLIILRHVSRFYILSGKKLFGNFSKKSGFPRAVFSDYADFFPAGNFKFNFSAKEFFPGGKLWNFKGKNPFSVWNFCVFAEAEKNRVFAFRHLGKVFFFLFKTPSHGFYGMHLFLQKRAAVRVTAGNVFLLVVNFLVNLAVAVHLFVKIALFASGHLFLFFKTGKALGNVGFIIGFRNGASRPCFSAKLFHMDYHIRGAFKKGFVVAYEKHRKPAVIDEIFKPFQSFNVDIVGRFIKKKDIRPFGKNRRHSDFYLFAAGKGLHLSFRIENFRFNSDLGSDVGNFVRQKLGKTFGIFAEFLYGKFFFKIRNFLGKIAENGSVSNDFAGIFDVIFHKFRVIDKF